MSTNYQRSVNLSTVISGSSEFVTFSAALGIDLLCLFCKHRFSEREWARLYMQDISIYEDATEAPNGLLCIVHSSMFIVHGSTW
jgi:hypothetical protein